MTHTLKVFEIRWKELKLLSGCWLNHVQMDDGQMNGPTNRVNPVYPLQLHSWGITYQTHFSSWLCHKVYNQDTQHERVTQRHSHMQCLLTFSRKPTISLEWLLMVSEAFLSTIQDKYQWFSARLWNLLIYWIYKAFHTFAHFWVWLNYQFFLINSSYYSGLTCWPWFNYMIVPVVHVAVK